jgi:hypothetical protein
MALRSPTPFHNFWGTANPTTNVAWTSGTLPNEGAVPSYQNGNLEAGDFAYVAGDSTFYVCTNPGVAQANAVWVALSTSIDRFAPRYIVGGPSDSTAAYDSGGFTYIPSNGNATWQAQLQAALNANAGDVHFRPGQFALVGALTVPVGGTIQGAGDTTEFTITAGAGDSLAAFILLADSKLSDCRITVSAGGASDDAVTISIVTASPTGGAGIARINNVRAAYTRDVASTAVCQSIFLAGADMLLVGSNCATTITGTLTPNTPADSLCAWRSAGGTVTSLTLSACSHSGSDAAVISGGSDLNLAQFTSAATTVVGVGAYVESIVNITGCKVTATTGYAVQIDSTDCTVGLSNNYLTTEDVALAAFVSTGGGRVVGNSIFGLAAAFDTSGGQNHAIGFNTLSGTATTAAGDEFAHNI